MLGSINQGFRRFGVVAGVASLLGVGFFAACAPSTPVDPATPMLRDQISSVSVETAAEGTVITLAGLRHPVFTAFTQEDPDRIIIDLPSVKADPELRQARTRPA